MRTTLLDLPSHLRERLASALDSGLLPAEPSAAALRSTLGTTEDLDSVAHALEELSRVGLSGRAAAFWMRSIGEVASGRATADLVWSGPEVQGLHARDTRRVYDELLGSAERSLWASTFVFFDGSKAFETLARHMEATPALKVTLLLNIQRKRGDTTAADQLVRRFADRLWKVEWPGTARPGVFYDPRSLDPDYPSGVLHSKAVVADDEAVFVTSANLTEAALDRNIEVGLLVRDRALAASLSSHFRGLIDRGLLKALPME